VGLRVHTLVSLVVQDWHTVKPSFADDQRYDQLWEELSGWNPEDYTCHSMSGVEASARVYQTMLQETSKQQDA
jgi:hypothetical protein